MNLLCRRRLSSLLTFTDGDGGGGGAVPDFVVVKDVEVSVFEGGDNVTLEESQDEEEEDWFIHLVNIDLAADVATILITWVYLRQ